MQEFKVDVAILGAGTAGMGAYHAAKKAGKKVLLIEGGPYGTTCARVGCMPSKLLIAAAETAHQMQKADQLGIQLNAGYQVDGKRVLERLRRERDRFAAGAAQTVENWPSEDRLRSYAHFIGPNELETDNGDRIHATSIVIATGSSPAIPEPLQAAADRLITTDEIFEWTDLPDSIAVFGPGVIGLELGQALHRLGVRMRLFGRGGKIGPLSDPKIRSLAEELFNQEFSLLSDAQVSQVSLDDQGVKIRFTLPDGQQKEEYFDYLLAATGRRPNLENLNLDVLNLQLDNRKQPLFNPQTGQLKDHQGQALPIFIAGDVNNYRPLLHEANDEGHLAGKNAATWPDINEYPRRTPLAVVFSDPQIALIGETLPELEKRLGTEQLAIGEVDFTNQGRSRVMLVNKGLLRVYANKKDGTLLGAEMLGPRAEHLAHLLAWSIQLGMTLNQLLELPFYHPVIEEGLRSALRSAAAQLDTRHQETTRR
ncbi:dihydrolipoyl dehydrogenase [Marinospirillum perlucidum]|uniref:dihydrolipoyl dehydrogenase n=1 Tax=Marinospirillum perlucidum TaxID=1982602 RepID=UPI000DF3AA31|nr:dihydrolipoyl dehydrogenase [Marinospirillum perlucidum]